MAGDRNKYIIATNFGWENADHNKVTWAINGKKEYVKKAVELFLKILNTDYIDLYYMYRLDKTQPSKKPLKR